MTWDSENIVKIEFPKILQEIEKNLRPNDHGFELIHVGAVPNSLPSILYQSKQCKLRIQSLRDRPHDGIELYVHYGRLHAPLDKDVIEWNNDKCYCWHSLLNGQVLNFLDGVSPIDLVSGDYVTPRGYKEFSESNKEAKWWSPPKSLSKRHAFLWKYYGQRLFNLFDLNYPNLWDDYRNFLKDYYKQYNEKFSAHSYNPPRYNVC